MDKKLDNFESFIKNSMDNHEASYSAGAWDSMQEAMNNSSAGADGFESFVKSSLNNHEVPYTSAAWKSFAPLLDKVVIPFYKTKGFIAGVSALVVAGVVFFSLPDTKLEGTKNTASNVVVNEEVKELSSKSEVSDKQDNNIVVLADDKLIAEEDSKETINNLDNNVDEKQLDKEEDKEVGKENTNVEGDVLNNENKTVIKEEDKVKEQLNNVAPLATVSGTQTDLPITSFDLKLTACEGETIILNPRHISSELTYQWLYNGESISKEISTKITLAKTGENNIDLIAYRNGERVGSRAKSIQVEELPKNNVIINEDKYALINEYSFKTNDNTKFISWNFGDGETSNELEANHTFKKQGKYKLSYNVTNKAGCSASFTKDVMVKGYYNLREELFFSPDGDGSLDAFLPEELKQINKPFEMVLYNRQGKLLFKTNSINNPWDGRDLEGNMVPFGVYVWVINMTNEFGHNEQYKGNVTKASN